LKADAVDDFDLAESLDNIWSFKLHIRTILREKHNLGIRERRLAQEVIWRLFGHRPRERGITTENFSKLPFFGCFSSVR